jgi:hypothetical protein
MPLTPQIALTIQLDDLQGNDIGSVGSPAAVQIALANSGATLPRIAGTTMLAKVFQRISYVGAPIVVTLWGNDVITPVGTYYVITIYDDQENVLQTGAYVFSGTLAADLSTLPQSFPSATSSVVGSEVDVIFSATPTFDCTQVNGPVEFFIILTANVTSSTLLPNFAGQIVTFRIKQDATGGRTFVWPTNVKNPPSIGLAPNQVTNQAFVMGSDGNAYPISSGLTTATVAQTGDIVRFNQNADNNWDAVNYMQPCAAMFALWGGPTGPALFGACTTGFSVAGGAGTGTVNPTGVLGPGSISNASAVLSPNTLIGVKAAENGTNSLIPLRAFYRWSHRFALNNIGAGTRYWMGLCTHNGGSGVGSNSVAILNTTKLATDTPNSNIIGFRLSGGTDTHWQAVCAIAAGAQTTVDTGVTPDTNPHLFEICPSPDGSQMQFFIDNVLVATITTNVPVAVPANAADGLGSMFWCGDNKNTNTAISGTWYSMTISMKQ